MCKHCNPASTRIQTLTFLSAMYPWLHVSWCTCSFNITHLMEKAHTVWGLDHKAGWHSDTCQVCHLPSGNMNTVPRSGVGCWYTLGRFHSFLVDNSYRGSYGRGYGCTGPGHRWRRSQAHTRSNTSTCYQSSTCPHTWNNQHEMMQFSWKCSDLRWRHTGILSIFWISQECVSVTWSDCIVKVTSYWAVLHGIVTSTVF